MLGEVVHSLAFKNTFIVTPDRGLTNPTFVRGLRSHPPINRAPRPYMRCIAAPAMSAAATERCFVLPLDRGDTL